MNALQKKNETKADILERLKKSLGNVSVACEGANVSRQTFYNYLKDDPDFAQAVANVNERTLDYVESALLQRIKEGDTTAMIFYLKTKGKVRGYGDRLDVGFDEKKVSFEIGGE